MLRTLFKRFGFNSKELQIVYIGYVRPVLEYADVIWHSGLTRKQSNDIESIQKRACKIILGHSFNSYNDELNYYNLDTLADRRLTHCLKFAENLNSNNRTSALLPPPPPPKA